ncbi:MAG: zinc-binding dehydrogenase, partial [Nannocystaceae bacterium]
EVLCHVHGAEEVVDGKTLRRRVQISIYEPDGTPVAELRDFWVQSLTGFGLDERWFLAPAWEPVGAPAAKLQGGRFLVVGSGAGIGEALGTALESAGHRVVGVPAQTGATVGDYRALLAEAFDGRPATAVVHLEGLGGSDDAPASSGVWQTLTERLDSALHLAQALASEDRGGMRLYVVTRGAQATTGTDTDTGVAIEQAPLLGLARTIQAEHPELRCTSVDLDPSSGPEQAADRVVQELLADDTEGEVRWRAGGREVARVIHKTLGEEPSESFEAAAGRSFRLETDAPGELDKLVLRTFERRPPGPGEVEIAVDAASLNFIDVMKAMGIYPGLGDGPIALGGECSGRITALGAGVSGLQVGQAVVAMAPSSLASHVLAPIHAVAARPELLNAAQAAAIPAVYMTAWYALAHLANLRPGERVLIHSATGGTGMAAIQIARHLGAEIFATAGSEEKRTWLREHGIAHAMDSRALAFSDQILEATGGEGVDVVLNSLSGAAIEASFAALAADGRFIEIGKTDIYSARGLSLGYFKKRLTFSAVDLAGLTVERPKRFAALMREVLGLFDAGTLKPPMIECFPLDRADVGFRKMAQAKHRGKLVFTVDAEHTQVRVPASSRLTIRNDRSYLITGGLGGLGLKVGRWL